MKLLAWLAKQFMKLPTLGRFYRGYISIGSFIFGILVSLLFGKSEGILFVAIICGMLYSHKKIINPFPNTVLILYMIMFSIGLLIFTTAVSKIVVIACYVIGVVLGIKLRKKFN